MKLTKEEAYKVGLNVFARVGATGDFIGEYSKTIREYNKMNLLNEITPPTATKEVIPESIPTQGITPESNMP